MPTIDTAQGNDQALGAKQPDQSAVEGPESEQVETPKKPEEETAAEPLPPILPATCDLVGDMIVIDEEEFEGVKPQRRLEIGDLALDTHPDNYWLCRCKSQLHCDDSRTLIWETDAPSEHVTGIEFQELIDKK